MHSSQRNSATFIHEHASFSLKASDKPLLLPKKNHFNLFEGGLTASFTMKFMNFGGRIMFDRPFLSLTFAHPVGDEGVESN